MKLRPLKVNDRVAHSVRGFGKVLEVFREGDCWVRFDNGYEMWCPREALEKLKYQSMHAA